jgi:hypothetical protein
MSTSKPPQIPDNQRPPTSSPLYEALDAIGFVGCADDEETLSVEYKTQIDFASKRDCSGKSVASGRPKANR